MIQALMDYQLQDLELDQQGQRTEGVGEVSVVV